MSETHTRETAQVLSLAVRLGLVHLDTRGDPIDDEIEPAMNSMYDQGLVVACDGPHGIRLSHTGIARLKATKQ